MKPGKIESICFLRAKDLLRKYALIIFVLGGLLRPEILLAQQSSRPTQSSKPTEGLKPAADSSSSGRADAPPTQAIATQIATVASVAVPSSAVSVAGARVISLDLPQLGAWGIVKLKSSNGLRILGFGVRADEQVIAAKLTLAYDYSPSMNEELSVLKVSMNDALISTERLVHERAAGVRREFSIDPKLFKDYNEFRFDFQGVYGSSCSNPLQSNFWLTLVEQTRLELTVVPKISQGDLKHLPAPFIDKADLAPQIPFVFSASPSLASLKAGGILASWFGIQAGAKGLRALPHFNTLPAGNAVLVLSGDEEILGIKSDGAASVSMRVHPTNPAAKLLVINGASEAGVLSAARAVALNHRALSGLSLKVNSEVKAALRLPYDAPAWVRTDRPMKLGELVRLEELRVQGFFPEVIRVNYRLPPDVFAWRSFGVPLQLKYRAARFPHHKSAALGIGLNNNFIDSVVLNEPPELKEKGTLSAAGEAVQAPNKSLRELSLFLPPYAAFGRDQLQFTFSTEITQGANPCDAPPNNFVAAIDAESTIDFSQMPKFAALPNLAYFVQSGFPFTKLADLAETSVVLGDKPSTEEVGVYLAVMGRMGESTGYPATRHSVIRADELASATDRDLIVIGSSQLLGQLKAWSASLPMMVENGVRSLKEPLSSWRPSFRWEQQDIDPLAKAPGQINLSGAGTLVAMMGFESPLKPKRSVVVLYADKATDIKKIDDLLADPARMQTVSGDFVVVGDKTAQVTKTSGTYFVGEIPMLSKIKWFLADHPLMVALATLVLAILCATVLYRPLAMLIRRRNKVQA